VVARQTGLLDDDIFEGRTAFVEDVAPTDQSADQAESQPDDLTSVIEVETFQSRSTSTLV
jgi:hypothetical protein